MSTLTRMPVWDIQVQDDTPVTALGRGQQGPLQRREKISAKASPSYTRLRFTHGAQAPSPCTHTAGIARELHRCVGQGLLTPRASLLPTLTRTHKHRAYSNGCYYTEQKGELSKHDSAALQTSSLHLQTPQGYRDPLSLP